MYTYVCVYTYTRVFSKSVYTLREGEDITVREDTHTCERVPHAHRTHERRVTAVRSAVPEVDKREHQGSTYVFSNTYMNCVIVRVCAHDCMHITFCVCRKTYRPSMVYI